LQAALRLALPEESIKEILNSAAQLAYEKVAPAPGGQRKVNVRVEKEGDKVVQIVVECDCGQVIPLDCVY